jgi:YHS domain-containing protein
MDRIIPYLLFAAFFYFMMRFGCGSHMVHGHHHKGQPGTGPSPERSLKDPVCGKEIEAGRGYTEVFSGREYRFCSRNCLDKFDANPNSLSAFRRAE